MSLKSKRQEFIGRTTALPDDDFISRLRIRPECQSFALAAREALGRICQVPPSHIHPEDKPELLAELVWDWDDMAVILEMEQLLHVPLGGHAEDFPRFIPGRFLWRKWPGPKTIGDWAAQVAEHVHLKLNANTTN
jgi:hypothetical protein